jgi:hypothetical protein
MGFADYDPVTVVRAVNGLQLTGKDAALDAVEGQRVGSEHYGLFWVLRVLFDVPRFPPVRLGTPTIPPPTRADMLPRFPIVIVRDIPLLVVRGYSLSGLPEPVSDHIAYYRGHGTIRDRPLVPSPSDGTMAEFRELWRAAYGDLHADEAVAAVGDQLAKVR